MFTQINPELKNYNTIKIGGHVQTMFWPTSKVEIIKAILTCKKDNLPFVFLAGGSNTVFPDEDLDYNQAVINLSKFDQVDFLLNDQGILITAKAGTELQTLIDLSLEQGSGTMVGLNRVPGSIGGAIVGNAGAYGTEIKDIVTVVKAIRRSDILKIDLESFILSNEQIPLYTLTNLDCHFTYRHSEFKNDLDWIVLEIELFCPFSSDIVADQKRYDEIATKRDAVYPKGFASPGSLFKNILFSDLTAEQQAKIPQGWVVYGNKLPVGRLLEELGLKGHSIGGIKMTDRHPNIMLNYNQASFDDAQAMVKFLQQRVKEEFGIEITPEVRFLPNNFGEFR
jgi:UDP-N-acetylmuramate dehydrogenase